MEQRLSLVTLGVTDLARARRFYEDGLGWTKNNAEEEIAFYQLNGLILAVWMRADLAEDANITDTGATFSGMALAFNPPTRRARGGTPTRSHDEVDEILALARRAAAPLSNPPLKSSGAAIRDTLPTPTGIPGKLPGIRAGRSTRPVTFRSMPRPDPRPPPRHLAFED